jgi:hypothetical protein
MTENEYILMQNYTRLKVIEQMAGELISSGKNEIDNKERAELYNLVRKMQSRIRGKMGQLSLKE